MRIYSNTIDFIVLRQALSDIALECPSVHADIEQVTLNGRRRAMTYQIKLEGSGARHTRHTNTGGFGSGTGDMAATWMDWGWLIAVLFRYEPTAVIGQYDSIENFHARTAREIPHRLRIDASVRNFARNYSAWWPNPSGYNTDYASAEEVTSPFTLVDKVCPPKYLIALRPASALEAWLAS